METRSGNVYSSSEEIHRLLASQEVYQQVVFLTQNYENNVVHLVSMNGGIIAISSKL